MDYPEHFDVIVVGAGNIYVCEALFRAKIDPRYSYQDYLHGAFGASQVVSTLRALPAPKGVLGRLRDLIIKAEDAGPRSGQ